MVYSSTTINFISAFLILILGWVLGTIFGNIIKKILKNLAFNKLIEKKINIHTNAERKASFLIKYGIFTLATITALQRIHIPLKIVLIILGIVGSLTLLLLLLAFKDTLPNLLGWFSLVKTQRIKIGETISINEIKGKLIEIDFIESKIETPSKEIISIPNAIMNKALKEHQ